MSGKFAVSRAKALETWLRSLIAAYQDRSSRPRDRAYSNLTRMPAPTQLYAITLQQGRRNAAVVTLAHDKKVENLHCIAVRVDSVQELAEFSEIADDYFGTDGLVRQDAIGRRIILPPLGVAEQACIALADLSRTTHAYMRPTPGRFEVGSMEAIQVMPPAALWRVRYRLPFPEPRSVLLDLGSRTRRRATASAPVVAPPPQQVKEPSATAYAAFAEPLIWFGPPPHPSSKDRILQRVQLPTQTQRLLHGGQVGGIETLVYSNGLVLAVTDDRSVARSTINQIFGVLSRSGVQSLALPDFELIEVTQFEAESGDIKGSRSVVTPRNRLLGPPTQDRTTQISRSLPEEIVRPLLDLADRCTREHDQRVASLRLLNAVTLLDHQFHTEAFVTAWSLIETSIERDFEAFWRGQGRSKTAIDQMDWKANQQVDLLIAIGNLDANLGEQIHDLRKRRNAIVHDLADATEQEALSCVDVASAMTPLPRFSEVLEPQMVFL